MTAIGVLAAAGQVAFGVALLLIAIGVVAGYYTRRGSGINQHPQGAGRAEAPGVGEGPSRIAGTDDGEQEPFGTHGTR